MVVPLALAMANARHRETLPAEIAEQAISVLRNGNPSVVSAVACAAALCETSEDVDRGVGIISNISNDKDILRILGANQ